MQLYVIISVDETAVCFDSTSNITFYAVGSRTLSLASTGHENLNFTDALADSANEYKKKPLIVFKGKVIPLRKSNWKYAGTSL